MQDYTIGESYTLPSLGKVYSREVKPEIKIRSMTTEEEMKRVASVDYPYKNMSEIIDDCLVEKPGISAYDMCIGDYQFLLHKLRVVTYGSDYTTVNKCIYCGSDTTKVIDLEDLEVLEYTEDFEKYREFDLPKSKKHIRLRVQTPRMLDEVSERVKKVKRKAKGQLEFDPTLIYTIAALIEEIDGQRPDVVKTEEWIRTLPMADTNTIIQYAEKMNESIGIDASLDCTCDVCGLTYHTVMQTTSEFFRPVLDFGR